jgi:hypothetical protein
MAKNRRLSDQAKARLRTTGGQFAQENNAVSFFRVDDIMRDVIDQVEEQLAERLTFWAKNIKTNAERQKGLREVHSQLSRETMSVVLDFYDLLGSAKNPSYREDDPDTGRPRQFKRYSNGAMVRALSDSRNYTFSNREFSFINKEVMDSHAKQWYRLNFGTVGRPGQPVTIPPMKFMGVQTGRRISLDQYKPSKRVFMPKGYWSGTFASKTKGTALKRGTGAFYPSALRPVGGYAKLVPMRPVKGIEGKHFLDAAALFINKRYPQLLENMIDDWMKRGL